MDKQHQVAEQGNERSSACPAWCVADHEAQGKELDQWHHSAPVELPLVEMGRAAGQAGQAMTDVAVAFDVALERPWGSPTTYILLGVGSQRTRTFCLTLESAERLVIALKDAALTARRCP